MADEHPADEYRTKREAHDAGVVEGIRQATAAARTNTDIMDATRLARVFANMSGKDRLDAGDLYSGTLSCVELAVEVAKRYNAERR